MAATTTLLEKITAAYYSQEKSSWSRGTYLVCGCIAALILLYVYERLPTWRLPNIPSPPESWLFSHLTLMAKHGPDMFIRLAHEYGPIYRFNFGRQPLVIVADADLCREVGIKKFKYMSNRSIPALIASSPLHVKGLFTTMDPRWSSMRSAVQPLYQPRHIASLLPLMERVVCVLKDHLSTKTENEDIDFSELILKSTTDIIGEAAFGESLGLTPSNTVQSDSPANSVEVSEFIKQHIYSESSLKMDLTATFSIIMGLLFPILQDPFRRILSRIPGTGDWKVEENNRKLTERLDALVGKRSRESSLETRTDFVSTVLSNKYSRDLFSPDYVSALAYEHLLAGSNNTSFSISMVLYLVSAHPDVEKKLLKEIDAFGPPDRKPTTQDLDNKFPYLNQVIKESMRFYMGSPVLSREVSEAVEMGGYMLPKGTMVCMALNVLAKDSRYFRDPEEFKPERFDPECEEEKSRHPYAYIPFGIGPRACLGAKFALQEIKVTVVHLYQLFTFEHSPLMEKPLEFQYGVTVSAKYGVRLRVRHRRPLQQNCDM